MALTDKINMYKIEKYVKTNDLETKVGYGIKRGKMTASFLSRPCPPTVEGGEETYIDIDMDLSDYNEGELKQLMTNYKAYIEFGKVKPTFIPRDYTKEDEEDEEVSETPSVTPTDEVPEE